MLSNWNVWDYFKNHATPVDVSKPGLYSFSFPDPYVQRVVHEKIQEILPVRTLSASLVTADWLNDNLCTLSFFGENENFLISSAEDLSKEAQEFFFDNVPDLASRHLIFFFNKEAPYRKKLISVGGVHMNITPPKFWEMDKFLDFLGSHYKVRLAYDAKQFFLETIENSTSSFHVAMNILSLNFPGKKDLSVEDLKSVLEQSRLDQFYLANLYSRKEKNKFYQKLMQVEADFEVLRQFFSFLQGHLIKLADTKVIEKKNALTKYDKEIISMSKLWTPAELMVSVQEFSKLEILCKSRSDLLFQNIRSKFFQTLS
ncbi:MAG: hypothetical protein ACOYL6_01850 [Bacteriovoracaceae bacterium]